MQCIAGVIGSPSITPDIIDANTNSSYDVTFTLANNLVAGSFINIVFPTQLIVQDDGCALAGQSCGVVGNNVSIGITASLPRGTTLTVTVNTVLSYSSAMISDSLGIYTYYYNSGYDSLVDQVASGITVEITPKSIKGVTITPDSTTNNDLTSY
jgi:hypothetical protein